MKQKRSSTLLASILLVVRSMKSKLLIIVLLGLSLGTAVAAADAADISGTWVFSIDTGKFRRSLSFVFKQPVGAVFAGAHRLAMRLEPIGSDKKTPQLAARYDALLKRVGAIPGVELASLVDYSPESLREWIILGEIPEEVDWPISAQGYIPQPGENIRIPFMQVYPNSFDALGVPLVAGRGFTPQENEKWLEEFLCRKEKGACPARVGIINTSMARHFFPNQNPVGRRFGFDAGCPPETICWYEVIGVVTDVRGASSRYEGREMFYLPFSQSSKPGGGQMTLVVRTTGDPIKVAAAVRAEARALDPQMPMHEAETLDAQGDLFTGAIYRGSGKEKIIGTVKGNKVVFSVEGISGGWEPFKHTYTGTLNSPTEMSGTIEFGEGSSGKWTATKK